MRITVDRGSDAVHLALTGGGGAETRELAEGISAEYDAQGRLVGVTIREVGRLSGAPYAAAALTVDLADAAGGAAGAARDPRTSIVTPFPRPTATTLRAAAPPPLTPAERATLAPLTWEAEAEAAMGRMPFFSRGRRRLAVVELARSRRLNVVTAALVEEAGER